MNVDLGVRGYLLSLLAALALACGPVADRRGATVIFASGADLQSANPLITTHPLARQVQRYVLLTTLVRYDSLLQLEPFLARDWQLVRRPSRPDAPDPERPLMARRGAHHRA